MLSADKQALKVATGRLVRAAGGQEAAVGFTRLTRHQALSDAASVTAEHAARFAPIDVIADLEAVTVGTPGHPVVTRQLARQAGYALVRLPTRQRIPAPADRELADHLCTIMREAGEVTLILGGHLRCGEIPAGRDAAQLRREIDDAIQALVELDQVLQAGGE
jgi:hypothetical protein